MNEPRFSSEFQKIHCAHDGRANGLDRVVLRGREMSRDIRSVPPRVSTDLVVSGGRRARKIVDLIDLKLDGLL